MKFKRKIKTIGHIEIAPMVDVVFLLVVYFLVASTLQENTAVKVDLPDSKQKKSVEIPSQIIITVSSDNKIYLGQSNKPVKLAKLGDKVVEIIEKEGGKAESKPVIVRGDKVTAYETIISVIDELSLRGIKNFNLSVKKSFKKEG